MKKKSKSKKKVDLDAFEKDLNESKAKSKTEDAEDDVEGHAQDGSHLENIDEEDLGDDPFARPDAPVGVDAGTEAWLNSDRDYSYEEVCPDLVSFRFLAFLHFLSVTYSILCCITRSKSVTAFQLVQKAIHDRSSSNLQGRE